LSWLKKLLFSHSFLGTLMLALLLSGYFMAPFAEDLRNKTFDLYQRIAPRQPEPEKMPVPVAIIDLDDATLNEFGQWPWPRSLLAELVDKLMQYNVSVIGFDMVFAEPDRTSPHQIVEQSKDLPENLKKELVALPTHEALFAEAIRRGRVVLGQVGVAQETDLSKLVRKVQFGVLSGNSDAPDPRNFLTSYNGLVGNLPELEDAALGLGMFSSTPDDDGIFRRVSLVDRVGDVPYPSLALEMLRVAMGGKDDYQMTGDTEGKVKEVIVRTADRKKPYRIPTYQNGKVWVHYAQYNTSDPIYISAGDVLKGTVKDPENRLRGALAVIGTSAMGLKDLRATPLSGAMPGVEVHAQLLETILTGAHLTRPDEVKIAELGIILVGGLLMVLMLPRLNAITTFLLSAVLIGASVAMAWHYYTTQRILMDASYPALSIFSMFLVLSYLNYMREERERRQIRTAFSHYVSPAVLGQIAAHPEKLQLGGETRHITIMFSDIRGFTTISERFNAQELTRFINGYLTPMTDAILSVKGTVDKYMGDAIMAFWNAPLDDAEHALNACRAALAMQEAVKALNEKMRKDAESGTNESENRRHYMPIGIGIGLNSGPCCVGNMGSNQRFDYSALGDDVNLASRLEGQCKTYGMDIVLGENTAIEVKDKVAMIELDFIQVKGKTEPITLYALMGDEAFSRTDIFLDMHGRMDKLLQAYRAQQWDNAISMAQQMAEAHPTLKDLAGLFVYRCKEFKEDSPGKGWDGVFVAKSK